MQGARAACVRALTDGVLLALHRDDYSKLLACWSCFQGTISYQLYRRRRAARTCAR